MSAPAEAAAPPSESVDRLPGPDVVRAVALIGVVVMNYHGYLILRGASPGGGTVARFFDPWEGPLSTRFASTFVLTAGVAVTLLTRRVVADRRAGIDGAPSAVVEMRWRLVRRGLVLYLLGQVLDVIWPGTIILYYGAMFVLAAALFTLSSRWVLAIGIGCALAAWAIEMWAFERREAGESVDWLFSPGRDSIRRLLFDLGVNGTHPLLPWMVFLCVGMVVGRELARPRWRIWCAGIGIGLFALSTFVSNLADTPFTDVALSRHPFDRGIVYVASALGTSLVAVAAISWIADRVGSRNAVVDPLRRAGQMSLTLYVVHILVFNLFVDWWEIVEPGGVGTALVFAGAFWVVAIGAGAVWSRRVGRGPLERVYRAIGG